MSRDPEFLGLVLLLYVIDEILLTPLGLETRTTSDVTSLGLAAGALSLAGLALAFVSLILLFRRPMRAPITVILAALFYLPALVVDQAGQFHATQAPPIGVTAVEVVQLVVVVLAVILALGLRKKVAHPTGSQTKPET